MQKKTYIIFTALLVTFFILLSGCSKPSKAQSVAPTSTTVPTMFPTDTPIPTNTPLSCTTPIPTNTPLPTSLPETMDIDLTAVYQSILDLQTENGLKEPILFPASGDPYLEEFYPGVFELEFKQKVFYVAPIAGFACEVLLLEVTNPEDIKTVQAVMQARIDKGASDTYYVEEAALWTKNARIHIFDNYIGMVVLPEGYLIPEDIFTDFK